MGQFSFSCGGVVAVAWLWVGVCVGGGVFVGGGK
jgi:hypothetical protein